MFFHVDESGNTGNNLFDAHQRVLSYGLLSSRTNVDARGTGIHREMTSKLGEPALHASPLGIGRLESISEHLLALHKKMEFEFAISVIEKRTYAVCHLFDDVFDQGFNPAVPWAYYWTPLRFQLIHYLDQIVDEDLLRQSWALCTDRRIEHRYGEVVALLHALADRVDASQLHPRIKEVMGDAFEFGIAHPEKLGFGTRDPLLISPNAVGFQFVFAEVTQQLRRKSVRAASMVAVDYQQQFNAAQRDTYRTQGILVEGLKRASQRERDMVLNHPLYRHLTRDQVLPPRLPSVEPAVMHNAASIGLQITDIYLWIINRVLQEKELPPGLARLASVILKRLRLDGVWMDGIRNRFRAFEEQLPAFEDLTPTELAQAQAAMDEHRNRVADLRVRAGLQL